MGDIYNIKVDSRTMFTVYEHQLWKPRWIEYFGGEKGVQDFIDTYKK